MLDCPYIQKVGMMKLERRRDSHGGRLYVSVRADEVEAFERAASELEDATGLSVSQLVVRQMLEAHKKHQRRLERKREDGTEERERPELAAA